MTSGSLATAFLPGRGGSGVYPLAINVQSGVQTLAKRSGAFVFLAQTPESQLNVVWVLPIHRATAMDELGAYNKAQLGRELLENGAVRGTVELLERHPGAGLTLAPTGLLADQLADVSNGFDARLENGEVDGSRQPIRSRSPRGSFSRGCGSRSRARRSRSRRRRTRARIWPHWLRPTWRWTPDSRSSRAGRA